MAIVNKVAQSGIITFDLEELFPTEPIEMFDLKDHLYRGMILREKDFREVLQKTEWSKYSGSYLAVYCSADAIIPNWAYMLVAANAKAFAKEVFLGTKDEVIKKIYSEKIAAVNIEQFRDQRVVVKGCSEKPVPVDAYLEITSKLKPVAKSIMYGEPCSTVPIYKKPN